MWRNHAKVFGIAVLFGLGVYALLILLSIALTWVGLNP